MKLLLLPNQLFPLKMLDLKNINLIYLIEEPRYFTDFKFHKLKIMYHRASMKKYADLLNKELKINKIKCIYKEFHQVDKTFYSSINKETTIYFNPIDHKLEAKFKKTLYNAIMKDNLNFLSTPKEIENNKSIFYKKGKYSHDMFYKFQRKRLNILIYNKKPINGKWSFDTENRNALPDKISIPKIPKIKKDKYYKEALNYVDKYFSQNYGSVTEWNFPIDTKTAINWLKNFIKKRLPNFGPYEDAVSIDNPFLFHSVLSPMMNIGILPDIYVVKITNDYYEKHKTLIPIASYEGFIRQVIGWRNYIYSIYTLEPKMYEKNTLKHVNKLNESYWLATTKIDPIDAIIKNIVKYCYCHHIERLMYLGNWFLINEIDPKEVYRIFMEWTIDAYDWVMVPNVMGMSQYADGGKMMTRIYFSSSNYINKMSNFKKNKDDEWWKIWDAIYYSFINKHYDVLKNNYATSRQAIYWKNKSDQEKEQLLKIAKIYKNNHYS
jgi:deoxyribodipyrimidine photolyase-related protein